MSQSTHTKLVHYVASTWWKTFRQLNVGLELDDLVQEAWIACLNAEAGFDASKGWAFSTYFVNAAKHHFWNLLQKAGREKAVNLELIEDDHLPIEDRGRDPADIVIAAERLNETLSQLSPVARLIMNLLIAPSDEIKAEFQALDFKREVARDAGIDERHPIELNITFICSLLAAAGVAQMTLASAKREIRELETQHDL